MKPAPPYPVATRPHPSERQVGYPLLPDPCRCQPHPLLDADNGFCIRCGRMVTPR